MSDETKRNPLADVLQAEVDGTAKRMIRDVAMQGDDAVTLDVAQGALDAGASIDVVREALRAASTEPPPLEPSKELLEMADTAIAAVNAVRERTAAEPGAAVFSLSDERIKRMPQAEGDDVAKIVRQFKRLQHVIAALVKKAGRIRINAADLRAIGDHPRFRMRMDDDGNVIITWER